MLGASVDGRVTCDCCGVGNFEIKSTFSHRDKNIERNSCLAQSTDTVEVEYILKHTHPYYTQVHHQSTNTVEVEYILKAHSPLLHPSTTSIY